MRPCSRQPSWRWATRPWPKRSRPGAGGRARRLPMPPSTPPDADGQISMSDTPSRGVIAPAATIGILAGGQLGAMTPLAAASLGHRSPLFSQNPAEPAAQVAPAATFQDFTNGQVGRAAGGEGVGVDV